MAQTQTLKRPLVSVIVPVYRAEAFLSQCADSVLSQTAENFELLLIDDGSPDGSPAMCDAYAARDPRVRVIHKPNGGVSSARNAGLDAAQGDFVVFIDSDDYADANYLEGLLSPLHEVAAPERVLILTDYQPFSPDGEESRTFPQPFKAVLSGQQASPQMFRDLIFGFRLFPPYCKLYRRDVIESAGLRFDTGIRSAEDFDFNMRYLEHMDEVRYFPLREGEAVRDVRRGVVSAGRSVRAAHCGNPRNAEHERAGWCAASLPLAAGR